jgi:PAS domain S-box-containing protein
MLGIAFGDDQGHITDANDAFLQLCGYDRDDLADDAISWPSLMPVDAHQRQIQALEEILATGRCLPFETEVIRKDGRRVPVLVGAARLSAQRREGVAFVLDITDRKRTVRRLKAELACADALADAETLPEAAPPLLRALIGALGWRAANLWAATPDGWRLVSRSGTVAEHEDGFELLAEKVIATSEWSWSAPDEALGVPLSSPAGCQGALILANPTGGLPDAELIEVCGRIGERIGKFLARRNTA